MFAERSRSSCDSFPSCPGILTAEGWVPASSEQKRANWRLLDLEETLEVIGYPALGRLTLMRVLDHVFDHYEELSDLDFPFSVVPTRGSWLEPILSGLAGREAKETNPNIREMQMRWPRLIRGFCNIDHENSNFFDVLQGEMLKMTPNIDVYIPVSRENKSDTYSLTVSMSLIATHLELRFSMGRTPSGYNFYRLTSIDPEQVFTVNLVFRPEIEGVDTVTGKVLPGHQPTDLAENDGRLGRSNFASALQARILKKRDFQLCISEKDIEVFLNEFDDATLLRLDWDPEKRLIDIARLIRFYLLNGLNLNSKKDLRTFFDLVGCVTRKSRAEGVNDPGLDREGKSFSGWELSGEFRDNLLPVFFGNPGKLFDCSSAEREGILTGLSQLLPNINLLPHDSSDKEFIEVIQYLQEKQVNLSELIDRMLKAGMISQDYLEAIEYLVGLIPDQLVMKFGKELKRSDILHQGGDRKYTLITPDLKSLFAVYFMFEVREIRKIIIHFQLSLRYRSSFKPNPYMPSYYDFAGA